MVCGASRSFTLNNASGVIARFKRTAALQNSRAIRSCRMKYGEVGEIVGWFAGVLSFISSWIYCISAYGFLLGLGLGWLPSVFVAMISFAVLFLLWGPLLFAASFLLTFAMSGGIAGGPFPLGSLLFTATAWIIWWLWRDK